MGQKVNPIILRVGITRTWGSCWYADRRNYSEFALEDARLRRFLASRFARDASASGRRERSRDAGISQVELERAANQQLKVTLHTAKPGIVIGRGGRGVDELRADLEKMTQRRVLINVQEVRQPELDAQLVAESIASQIERRIAYKRAVRQAVGRSLRAGAKGIKVICGGRLGGGEISRVYTDKEGKIPLHTFRADIDYGFTEARTVSGRIGIKVWIYKGEVLPEKPAGAELEKLPLPAGEKKPRPTWRRLGVIARPEVSETTAEAAPAPESPQPAAPSAPEAPEPPGAAGEPSLPAPTEESAPSC
jgi:small subunit ribosomal protein S3